MSQILAGYPDAEKTIAGILTGLGVTVYARLPADWKPPAITVQRIGGFDDGVTDSPRVDVSVYSDNRSKCWEIAEKARQAILASPGTVVKGALVDNAATDVPHQQLPSEDAAMHMITTTYRLAMRRPVSKKNP